MAYATVDEMIVRFGEAEMMRLTTPANADLVAVQREPAMVALGDASAMIDTYLRKRYRAPLDVAPKEIKRACCILARYDLATGEQKQPTETMVNERKETLGWLKQIANGDVVLDLEEVTTGDESFAAMQSREPVFGRQCGGRGLDDYGPGDNGDFW
jgi:phage gp36-like protein